MEPTLALEYNSRGTNGLVGMGWTLTGFSQITRCPHTVASDFGKAGPIKFDNTDALCLDGERLLPWYGTYTTEHNTFISGVVSTRDANGNPLTFTIYEKSGKIRHYTNQDTTGQGSKQVFGVWALTQVEDRYGNAVNYTYATSDNYIYPTSIDYTASKTNANLIANRHVKFSYEPRSDIETAFNVTTSILRQRLKTIETWAPDASSNQLLVRRYTLTYATGSNVSITQRSLLKSIVASDRFGNRLGSTDFEWELGAQGYARTPTSVTDYNQNDSFATYSLLDMNGDGFDDLLYVIKDSNGKPELAARLWKPGLFDFGAVIPLQLQPMAGAMPI